MKDCLNNSVTNFVKKTYKDGELKGDDIRTWLNENVFSLIRHTNNKAVRVYDGEETLQIWGKNGAGKDIVIGTRLVMRLIGWNLVEI